MGFILFFLESLRHNFKSQSHTVNEAVGKNADREVLDCKIKKCKTNTHRFRIEDAFLFWFKYLQLSFLWCCRGRQLE